jgi:uncharacterized protein (DUF697 family)
MHGYRPPVLGVATHCDLLEPKVTRLHAAKEEAEVDVQEKLGHVTLVERALDQKLKSRDKLRPHVTSVLGASTYMSWRPDGSLRSDERWRIDALAGALYKHIPDEGRGAFVRIARVRTLQEELAINLTKAVAAVCAGIAVVPIPFADMIPITTLQATLIAGIAWIAGRPLDLTTAGEFATGLGINVGVGFAFREGFRAVIKYVFPGGGSAVSGAVAFTGTMAVGAAARAYFIRGETMEKAKKEMKRTPRT